MIELLWFLNQYAIKLETFEATQMTDNLPKINTKEFISFVTANIDYI